MKLAFWNGCTFWALLLPVVVPLGNKEIDTEIEQAQSGKQPVEEIQMVPVDVVSNQPATASSCISSDSVHHLHQDGAEEVAKRHGCPEKAARDRFQILRHLVVEELQQAYVCEHVSYPENEVLKRQPEDADGERLHQRVCIQHPLLSSHALPLHLHHRSHCHGHRGEDEANPHALQVCYPGWDACELSYEWDHDPVVDGDDYDQESDGDDGKGSRWYIEAFGDSFIHGDSLLD